MGEKWSPKQLRRENVKTCSFIGILGNLVIANIAGYSENVCQLQDVIVPVILSKHCCINICPISER
jgi:hypothetical protein